MVMIRERTTPSLKSTSPSVLEQYFEKKVPLISEIGGFRLYHSMEDGLPDFAAPPGKKVSQFFERLSSGRHGSWAQFFPHAPLLGADIDRAWLEFWRLYKVVGSREWKSPEVVARIRIETRTWEVNLSRVRDGPELRARPVSPTDPESTFPDYAHAEYVHLFGQHTADLLALHKEIHSFSCETQELRNAKAHRKFFSCSKRTATECEEIAYADICSIFNPVSVVSLAHFKTCPKSDVCGRRPFARWGNAVNHLEKHHGMTKAEAVSLYGTKEACEAKWEQTERLLAERLLVSYRSSLFWNVTFPTDVNAVSDLPKIGRFLSVRSSKTVNGLETGEDLTPRTLYFPESP
jgi:hypothetical protein